MSYYAKDCIQLFLIGLIPSIFVKGGVICWAIICIGRYIIIKMKWDEQDKKTFKTKAEFNAHGYYPPDHWFDEEGNYHPERCPINKSRNGK